jgi:tRNA A-37 threonylcarbamoyl transferase component Bud32
MSQEDPTSLPNEGAGSPDPVADSLQIGSILAGRYRIVQRLGNGAMGAVYLGEHLRIGRKDAIKVLRDSLAHDREAMARFIRGARSVSKIRHENVCTIYDFSDTADGVQFLAMEYIPGSTLRDALEEKGTFPIERALDITVQAANALQAAHDAGIVHRDLKPANIMLMPGRGGADIVKVVDFDIAKAQDDSDESEVTRLGFVVGTPEYMSPEQLTGERLDGRSDVYSLAIVFYRMVTGLVPFPSDNTREMLVSRLTTAPKPLAEMMPGKQFPPALQSVLDWALQRNPDERTPSAATFAHALKEATGSLARREPTPPGGMGAMGSAPATRVTTPVPGIPSAPSQPAPRSYKMPLIAAGIVALGLIAWAVYPVIRGPTSDVSDGTPGLGAANTEVPVATTTAPQSASEKAVLPPTDPGRGATPAGNPLTSGSAATAPITPPNVPASANNSSGIDFSAAIERQFRAVIGLGPDAREKLEAIRDTSLNGYEQVTSDALRAKAAFTAANALFQLQQREEATKWAQSAYDLCPACRGYRELLDLLKNRDH